MKLKLSAGILAAVFSLASCSEPSDTNSTTAVTSQVSPPVTETPTTSVPSEVTSMADYEALEKAALSGDYQAQRNVAYTLSTSIPHNVILGCAWRIVIIESGSTQVDQSDTGNKTFYCGKLSKDEFAAAEAQAKTLQGMIERNQK